MIFQNAAGRKAIFAKRTEGRLTERVPR